MVCRDRGFARCSCIALLTNDKPGLECTFSELETCLLVLGETPCDASTENTDNMIMLPSLQGSRGRQAAADKVSTHQLLKAERETHSNSIVISVVPVVQCPGCWDRALTSERPAGGARSYLWRARDRLTPDAGTKLTTTLTPGVEGRGEGVVSCAACANKPWKSRRQAAASTSFPP